MGFPQPLWGALKYSHGEDFFFRFAPSQNFSCCNLLLLQLIHPLCNSDNGWLVFSIILSQMLGDRKLDTPCSFLTLLQFEQILLPWPVVVHCKVQHPLWPSTGLSVVQKCATPVQGTKVGLILQTLPHQCLIEYSSSFNLLVVLLLMKCSMPHQSTSDPCSACYPRGPNMLFCKAAF